MKLKKWMSDSLVTIAIVLGALLFTVSIVAAIATWKLTSDNHALGVQNHALYVKINSQQTYLKQAGTDQVEVAINIDQTENVICQYVSYFKANIDPFGPSCPPAFKIPVTKSTAKHK